MAKSLHHPRKNALTEERHVLQAKYIDEYIFKRRRRRCYGRHTYVPMTGSKVLGPYYGQLKLKSPGFLNTCINYSPTPKHGSLFQKPLAVILSRLYMPMKRLRHGTLRRIPEGVRSV